MPTEQKGSDMELKSVIDHYIFGRGIIIGFGERYEGEIFYSVDHDGNCIAAYEYNIEPVYEYIVQFGDMVKKIENPYTMEVVENG